MSGALGVKLSEHRVRLSWALNNVGAAALGVGIVGWLNHALEESSPKLLVGSLVMLGASAYFVWAGVRALKLTVCLHERGLAIGDCEVTWDQLARGELRYVPGAFKSGLRNEKNCMSLVVFAGERRHSIPRQLQGFEAVVEAVRAKAPLGVERVLVPNAFHA